jgi:hypothetical protein
MNVQFPSAEDCGITQLMASSLGARAMSAKQSLVVERTSVGLSVVTVGRAPAIALREVGKTEALSDIV